MLEVNVRAESQGLFRSQQVQKHLLQVGEPDADGVELAEGFDGVVLQLDNLFEEATHLEEIQE